MARFLIDANLPRWFSLWAGGECEFVHDLGAGWSDTQIWDYAAANSLTIVSKDADFSDRVLLAGDAGPRVIHVRVGKSQDRGTASISDGGLAGRVPRERWEQARAGVSGPD